MKKFKITYEFFHQVVFNKTIYRAVFMLYFWKVEILKPLVRPSASLTFCILLYSFLWTNAMSRVKLTCRWLVGLAFLEGFLFLLFAFDYSEPDRWSMFFAMQVFFSPFYIAVSLLLLILNGNTYYNLWDYLELRNKRNEMKKKIEQMLINGN